MNKLSAFALLLSIGMIATPTLYADPINKNISNGYENISHTSSSTEAIQLADRGRWSRKESREVWCERHPRECHREWCRHHPGACGSSFCEKHPRKCRENWCRRHPGAC